MSDYPKLPGTQVIVMSSAPPPSPDVLGAIPTPPGYTNHVGSGRDTAGNLFLAVTVDGPNSGDVDVAIMRRAWPAGTWQEVFRFSEAAYGKHGYGTLQPLPDGSLSCCLSERNASGQTVAIERIVPPEYAQAVWSAGSGSGGGFVPMQAGYVRVFAEEAGFEGQRTIDLSAFPAIPQGISGLAVRVCAIAEAKDRTLRAAPNTDGAGASSICAWTQAPDTRIYDSGTIGVGPNHTIVVWTPQGRIKQGWVDVMGVHY